MFMCDWWFWEYGSCRFISVDITMDNDYGDPEEISPNLKAGSEGCNSPN